MAIYKTEMERIAAANRWAEETAKTMPKAVAEYGEANVISDLVREFLMSAPSSQELINMAAEIEPEHEE